MKELSLDASRPMLFFFSIKHRTAFLFLLVVFLLMLTPPANCSSKKLLLFAGAASKPPTEEVIGDFQKKTDILVETVFGGSGFVLSQMKLARRGDIYFPGSSDFMEVAKRGGLVRPESEKVVAYLVPAINVQKGNPKSIKSLKDLTKRGIRLAIANPEMVCVGAFAVEIIERNLILHEKESLRRNLVNYTESCEKTANVVSLKAVDAVIGWTVFQDWDPDRIETICLKPDEIPRIGYIPIATSGFTKNPSSAQRFIDFLVSSTGRSIFRKYGYLMDPEEARRFARPNTPVGGEYNLPKEWRTR